MILLAAVYRTHDGLPLTASTDVEPRPQLQECQRNIKLLSKRLQQFPDRCTLAMQGFFVHYINGQEATFMILCEENYPTVLAFSFLNELMCSFISLYDGAQVLALRRPYGLMSFDNTIHKAKQRYNSPKSLATKLNLADLSQEIRLRPAFQITREDIDFTRKNGYVQHNTYRPTVAPGRRLVPLSWLGWTAFVLSVFCAILNLFRAMSIIGHGHLADIEGSAYHYGAMFFLSGALNSVQVYLLMYFRPWRKLCAYGILLLIAACNIYISEVRTLWLLVFHGAVASFTTFNIVTNGLQEKLPGYNV